MSLAVSGNYMQRDFPIMLGHVDQLSQVCDYPTPVGHSMPAALIGGAV